MSHGDALVAVSDMDMENSVSYSQTMAGSKSNLLLIVMKVEMHLLHINKVWKLVDLPEEI